MSAEREGLLPVAKGPMNPEPPVRMVSPESPKAPASPEAPEAYEVPVPRFRCKWIIAAAALATTVLVVGGVVIGVKLSESSSSSLSEEEQINGIWNHLNALEVVAKAHGNSRSVLTGYNGSAEYIMQALSATDLKVSTQLFKAPIWDVVEPPYLEILGATPPIALIACPLFTGWQKYQVTCDYGSIRYGGNGNYSLEQPVVYVSDPCDPASYNNFPAGQIVLFESSSECTLYDQTLTAENAGVGGIIISNPVGTAGIPRSRVYESATWTPETQMVQVPCVGVTSAIGTALRQNGTTTVRMNVAATLTIADTYNVFAETNTGSADDVVMIGAHLDSVPEGPGINDNGSGSSMILQIAIEYALGLLKAPERRLRFAWWGAEEIGLVGSNYYVTDLVNNNPEELDRIAGYLNFDMEAGPNYIRMIYDGSTAPEAAQNGSMALEALFKSAWAEGGYSFDPTPMGGGSDFLPFILAGVPASGTATGASGIKSEGEREVHGGIANAALDPCYHAPCDTAANVNVQSVKDCNFALRKVLETLTLSESSSLPRRKPGMLRSTDFTQMQAAHSRGFHMSCDARDEV